MKLTKEEFMQKLLDGVCLIPLGHNKYVQVDEWNFGWLLKHAWNDNDCGYAYRKIRIKNYKNNKTVYMHHEIAEKMGLDIVNFEIDHKDHDPFNNQEENLREATDSQQGMNKGLQRNNTSGFPGVAWGESNKAWRVQIWKGGKVVYCSYHKNKEEAIEIRKQKAKEIFGEYYNDECD